MLRATNAENSRAPAPSRVHHADSKAAKTQIQFLLAAHELDAAVLSGIRGIQFAEIALSAVSDRFRRSPDSPCFKLEQDRDMPRKITPGRANTPRRRTRRTMARMRCDSRRRRDMPGPSAMHWPCSPTPRSPQCTRKPATNALRPAQSRDFAASDEAL
jgi:hypothetical protein